MSVCFCCVFVRVHVVDMLPYAWFAFLSTSLCAGDFADGVAEKRKSKN